jgi:CRISPR-associated protein Cst1
MSEQRYKIYLRDWYFNAGLVGFLRLFGGDINQVKGKGITVQDNYIEFGAEVLADVDSFVQNYEAKLFTHLFEDDKSRYLEKAEKLLKNYHKEDRGEFKRKTEIDEIFSAGKVFEKLLEVLHCPALKSIASWEDAERFSEKLKASLGRAGEEKEFCNYYLNVYCTNKIADYIKMREFLHSLLKNEQRKETDAVCFGCQNLQRKAKVELDNSLSQVLAFNKDNRNWQWNFGNSNNDFCSLCAIVYLCVPLGLLRKVNDLSCLIEGDDVQGIFGKATEFIKRAGSHKEGNVPSFVQLTNYVTEKEWEASRDNITFIELKLSDVSGGQGTAGYDIYQYYIDGATARFLQENFKKKDTRGLGYVKTKDSSIDLYQEIIKQIISNKLGYHFLSWCVDHFIKGRARDINIGKICHVINKYKELEIKGNNMSEKSGINYYWNGFCSGDALKQYFEEFDPGVLTVERGNDNRKERIAYPLLKALDMLDYKNFMNSYSRLYIEYARVIKTGYMQIPAFDSANETALIDFGYGFIAGLISINRMKNNDKNVTKEENN